MKIFMGIPTVNRADLLKDSLIDIEKNMPDLYKLIIVDNGNQKSNL